jgi:hypothetical protein
MSLYVSKMCQFDKIIPFVAVFFNLRVKEHLRLGNSLTLGGF